MGGADEGVGIATRNRLEVPAISASNCAVCPKAFCIRPNLNSRSARWAAPSARGLRVVPGSTTTMTSRKFLPAAPEATGRRCRSARPARRTASRGSPPPWQTEYRLTADEIASSTPWDLIALRSSGRCRRARIPPWIFGWSVFTRPSIISGKPVRRRRSSPAPGLGDRLRRAAGRDQAGRRGRRDPARNRSCRFCPRHAELARRFGVFLDTFPRRQLTMPSALADQVVSRGRALSSLLCLRPIATAGIARCVSQARSSGSTTPGLRVHERERWQATCSCTSRRSRETDSGRSKKARPLSSKSSTVRRARRPATSRNPPNF